jgi:hypothetical protein
MSCKLLLFQPQNAPMNSVTQQRDMPLPPRLRKQSSSQDTHNPLGGLCKSPARAAHRRKAVLEVRSIGTAY